MRWFTNLGRYAGISLLMLWVTNRVQGAEQPKTAEQVFKNIVELKGTPADQLIPAMQFISSSLGVECSFCHVEGKMDLDDKPEKKTAREMMAMMFALNKSSFGGHREITCYSCHHGAAHPVSTPPVLESDLPQHKEAATAPAGPSPTVDEILNKYITALGGAEAIQKITSREGKGLIVFGENQTPIEVFTKAPNKRISVTHMGKGESYTAFDGTSGWLGNTGRPARQMSPAESEAAGLDAEFYLALRIKEIFPEIRRGRPETIRGFDCSQVIGLKPGHPPVRFYFDNQTGLLMRLVRYGETPLGRSATQIDYADYRPVNGVRVPWRWTLARSNGRFTIQLSEVKANVPLDDEKFARPAGEVK